MIYIWKVENLERQQDTGAVTVAHWRCSIEDGKYYADLAGATTFSPDPTEPNFIPFENLTESIVLDWVWKVEDQSKEDFERIVSNRLQRKKEPVIVSGTPW